MGICVITVDLDCCRCKAKIAKVLDCLKAEFPIEKVEFEEKDKKVVVRGKYDAEKLCKAVWCKAGKIVVKEIVIVDVWPPPPPPPKPEEKPKPPEKCDCHHCKHVCCKVCSCCCDCQHCKPKPEEKKEEKPKPPAPKVEYKLFPYPYVYPCPSWPYQCPPHQQCQSCQQKPPAPPPPPPPPQPQPCTCSNHGWGGAPPGWSPHMPVWPPPWASTSNMVIDENQCSVM